MRKIKGILCGAVVSMILVVVLILIFSAILVNTNIKDTYIDTVVSVIYGICTLIGSIISSRNTYFQVQ